MGDTIYKRFTDLEVWQNARALKISVCKLVTTFPPEEKYKLSDQLIRASRSIQANIAEGYGRYTYKEQIRFCVMARGSLYEVHNHLIEANDCEYITKEALEEFEHEITSTEKRLNGYISWLRKRITAEI